jgi:pimeloyl-ACP methyl ester carboxylesterase
MANNTLTNGIFSNGIPYARFGSGSKIMLFFAGGPGNLVPSGLGAVGFVRGMRPFADEYTITVVSRKSGLPQGYTTKDMSEDYAELIRDEFDGHVDLVLAMSYGGLIAQHFAADHADLFDHIVIAVSGPRVSDEALRQDVEYAELIAQHKDREAMALRSGVVTNRALRAVMRALLWTLGKGLLGKLDETFRRDVVIEARAERTHHSSDSLRRIQVPVLIIGGAEDFAFPRDTMEEMAHLIPHSTLKLYDAGHMTAIMDKRFVHDVREFVSAN